MRSANLAFAIEQAQHPENDANAFAAAVKGAIEVGVIVPSILRANLEKIGYSLVNDKAALSEYGFKSLGTLKRVVVRDAAGTIIAMGAAGDHDEAILHAVLGWFRENPVGGAVAPPSPISLEPPTEAAPVN